MRQAAVTLFLILFVASCSNIGSTELPFDRLSYNSSLQYSDLQQQLINIVRLRYSDPPYFLSVNSIVSQFNITKSGSLSLSNNSVPGPPALLGTGDGSVSFSESPTITYTPLQGAEFVTKLMTPVDISVIYMLLRAGWGFNHVLRPLVQRFGILENAVVASRVTSSRRPQFKEFLTLGSALRKLQHNEDLIMTKDKVNKTFAIKFTIRSFEPLDAKERAVLAKLRVTPEQPYFWLVSFESDNPNLVYLETRTVLGLLNYFSKGVDIPPEDVVNKQVPMTYFPNGDAFDWHVVTKGLMDVHYSRQKPQNAFVSVRYRQRWYYISNSDFESKESLNLIVIIMGIYQGSIKSVLPVFTVS